MAANDGLAAGFFRIYVVGMENCPTVSKIKIWGRNVELFLPLQDADAASQS